MNGHKNKNPNDIGNWFATILHGMELCYSMSFKLCNNCNQLRLNTELYPVLIRIFIIKIFNRSFSFGQVWVKTVNFSLSTIKFKFGRICTGKNPSNSITTNWGSLFQIVFALNSAIYVKMHSWCVPNWNWLTNDGIVTCWLTT